MDIVQERFAGQDFVDLHCVNWIVRRDFQHAGRFEHLRRTMNERRLENTAMRMRGLRPWVRKVHPDFLHALIGQAILQDRFATSRHEANVSEFRPGDLARHLQHALPRHFDAEERNVGVLGRQLQ